MSDSLPVLGGGVLGLVGVGGGRLGLPVDGGGATVPTGGGAGSGVVGDWLARVAVA